MASQIKILTSADEPALFQVFDSWSDLAKKEKRIFHTREELIDHLARRVVLGYFEAEELCGFLVLAKGIVWEILLVLVREEKQGRGIAGALIDALAQKAHAEHVPELWLEVHTGNARAIEFYKRKEFVPQGSRAKYYRDGSDAVNMCYYVTPLPHLCSF